MITREPSLTVYDALIALGQFQGLSVNPKLMSSPILAALRDAGTAHIYADTASLEELMTVLTVDRETILKEIDGNTVNQPLLAKVVNQYLKQDDPAKWARHLREQEPELSQGTSSRCSTALFAGRSAPTSCGPSRAVVRGK